MSLTKPSREQLQKSRPTSQRAAVAVINITVDGLFGQFDYTLPDPTSDSDLRDLFILYGDNGSGKTTILKLLFHLLSPGAGQGHRTAIKSIPFKRFGISLSDGTTMTLSRSEGLVGGYAVEIRRNGQTLLSIDFGRDKERPGHFATAEQEQQFLELLAGLNLTITFLSADREIESDSLKREGDELNVYVDRFGELVAARNFSLHARSGRSAEERVNVTSQTEALMRAITLASTWIKDHVLDAANRGTDSSHSIYADIVRRLVQAPTAAPGTPSQEKTERLKSTLQSLAVRTQEYARYGFIPLLPVDDMVHSISAAAPETVEVIEKLLEPYIQGTNARLKELEDIHSRTQNFVDSLNSFLTHKTISFDLANGLSIRLPDGGVLDPSWLSSGEKHLLLLFTHTLMSNDRNCIFIIDEPELSLNIKWQRKLIRSLLGVVRGSDVQFILATHAIELLAESKEKVVRLEPLIQRTLETAPGAKSDSSNPSVPISMRQNPRP